VSSHFWDDEADEPGYCRCACHGTIELHPDGSWRSYINCPPRLDNAMGYAESCQKCEVEHWIATAVHDQLASGESDITETANAYLAHFNSKQRKK